MRQTVIRAIHDIAHIALLPMTALLVAGFFNEQVRVYVERFDFVTHIGFTILAFHSLHDWLKLRRERKAHSEHHGEDIYD